jgi:cyclase
MKRRIIPAALLTGGSSVVTSQCFSPWRSVGSLAQHLELQVARNADEIHIIDITASSLSTQMSQRILSLCQSICNIPVGLGGGISDIDTAKRYIRQGADKVIIGSLFMVDRLLIRDICNCLGSQSVSLRLDYSYCPITRQPFIYDYLLGSKTDLHLYDALDIVRSIGPGELTLTCVDRDGLMQGLDPAILSINLDLDMPVLVAGGASSADDCLRAFNAGYSGVVASSMFVHTENTPATLRNVLSDVYGVPMRRSKT